MLLVFSFNRWINIANLHVLSVVSHLSFLFKLLDWFTSEGITQQVKQFTTT